MAAGDIDTARFGLDVTLLENQPNLINGLTNQQFDDTNYDNVKSLVLETTGGNATKQITVVIIGRKIT